MTSSSRSWRRPAASSWRNGAAIPPVKRRSRPRPERRFAAFPSATWGTNRASASTMADQAHAESSLPEPTEPHAALLRAALDSFVAGRSLSETELGALSSLSQAGRELFRATWSGLEAELRASLLPVLSAVERRDARLDFTAVYQVALADPDPEVRPGALCLPRRGGRAALQSGGADRARPAGDHPRSEPAGARARRRARLPRLFLGRAGARATRRGLSATLGTAGRAARDGPQRGPALAPATARLVPK